MVDYYVYENQWLFVALFGGGALLVMFALTYWALWRPREKEKEAAEERVTGVVSFLSWGIRVVPWAVLVAALGVLAFSIRHTWMAALKPPNW